MQVNRIYVISLEINSFYLPFGAPLSPFLFFPFKKFLKIEIKTRTNHLPGEDKEYEPRRTPKILPRPQY